MENTQIITETPDKMSEYRKTAFKVGLFVTISFALRFVAGVLINGLYTLFGGAFSVTTLYTMQLALSGICLQIAPSFIAAGMFGFFKNKGKKLKEVYTVPNRLIKAVGNFAAVYGMGQIANLLTILVKSLIVGTNDLNDSFNTATDIAPPNMASAWVLFFMLVVIAPVFEEFIFRGVLMDALKPYGNGLAIFVTGILFGIYHGNFTQLFYTATIGIALGYIANVTNSIFATTIIHAIFNSVSGILFLLMSTDSVQEYVLNGSSDVIPDKDMGAVLAFALFTVTAMVLILVGIICAVLKIKQIKRYKVPKVWSEVSTGRKISALVLTVPSVIAILLIVDTFAGWSDMLIELLYSKL